jgi:hypothetical protein
MHISKMTDSKYLKKEDVGNGKLVTIKSIKQENVAREDQEADNKYILMFREEDKGLVLNSTNIQLCAMACGSQETDEWIGKQIVLFEDPSVSFGGKLVGGIRIRKPRSNTQSPPPPAQSREAADERMAEQFDDTVPF